jgi:hypothetical protein
LSTALALLTSGLAFDSGRDIHWLHLGDEEKLAAERAARRFKDVKAIDQKFELVTMPAQDR